MHDKLSARDLLLAFNCLREEGEQRGDSYYLNVLHGDAGHDGYTVTLSDGTVTATVGFHNSVQVDAPNHQALEQFIERVEKLAHSQ